MLKPSNFQLASPQKTKSESQFRSSMSICGSTLTIKAPELSTSRPESISRPGPKSICYVVEKVKENFISDEEELVHYDFDEDEVDQAKVLEPDSITIDLEGQTTNKTKKKLIFNFSVSSISPRETGSLNYSNVLDVTAIAKENVVRISKDCGRIQNKMLSADVKLRIDDSTQAQFGNRAKSSHKPESNLDKIYSVLKSGRLKEKIKAKESKCGCL